MSVTNSFSIFFFLRTKKLDKNGQAPIFLRITANATRCELSLKRKVEPSNWCSVSEKIKPMGSNPNVDEINRHLEQVKAKIYRIQSQLVIQGKPFSAATIKTKFLGLDRPAKTLLSIYDEHNGEIGQLVGKGYSYGGHLRHVRTRNHLASFIQDKYKRTDILLDEVDLSFVKGFHHYLKTQGIGNSNTTTKYVTNFKKIMRIAFANNWVKKDPFYHWKASWKKVEREILSENELREIMEKELSIKRLDQVRDIFIFCCFTGLAYIDVQRFSREHLVTGIDGKDWIVISRSKTDSRSSIPLLEPAKKILNKYAGQQKIEDPLLPVISNQKTNVFLKE
ncbi:MAG: site-specific integrase, partial [Bacteroidota bacterium]